MVINRDTTTCTLTRVLSTHVYMYNTLHLPTNHGRYLLLQLLNITVVPKKILSSIILANLYKLNFKTQVSTKFITQRP